MIARADFSRRLFASLHSPIDHSVRFHRSRSLSIARRFERLITLESREEIPSDYSFWFLPEASGSPRSLKPFQRSKEKLSVIPTEDPCAQIRIVSILRASEKRRQDERPENTSRTNSRENFLSMVRKEERKNKAAGLEHFDAPSRHL